MIAINHSVRKFSMRLATRAVTACAVVGTTANAAQAMMDGPHPLTGPACCWLLFVALAFLWYLIVSRIVRNRTFHTNDTRDTHHDDT